MEKTLHIVPSWPLVGVLLILLGLFVKFEIQVVDSEDQDQIKGQKG